MTTLTNGNISSTEMHSKAYRQNYSAYGFPANSLSGSLVSYLGESWDIVLKGYHLGLGHRVYIPALFRFITPDRLSPFNIGGLNAYSYCSGDPVNYSDPSGKNRIFRKHHRPIIGQAGIPKNGVRTRLLNAKAAFEKPEPRILHIPDILDNISKYLNHSEIDSLARAIPETRASLAISASRRAKKLIKDDHPSLIGIEPLSSIRGLDPAAREVCGFIYIEMLKKEQAINLLNKRIQITRAGFQFDYNEVVKNLGRRGRKPDSSNSYHILAGLWD